MITKKNDRAINEVFHKVNLAEHNFRALVEIMVFDTLKTLDTRNILAKNYQKMIDAQSAKTRAKYYSEIISMFHSASAILHNGKYHYKDLMEDIDMDEIKQFLKEKAKTLLEEKPSPQSRSWQIREAALKGLDLEDMI